MSAKSAIFDQLKKKVALGNTARSFKHVASDLLHASGEKPSRIAEGTFLSVHTIARVMDCEEPYRPQSETLERIFRYCNAVCTFEHEIIKPKFQNKPKEDMGGKTDDEN